MDYKESVKKDFVRLYPFSNQNSFYFFDNDKLKLFSLEKNMFKKTSGFMGLKSDYYLSLYLCELNEYYEYMMKLQIENPQEFQIELYKFMFNYAEVNYAELERGMISYCSHAEGFLNITDNKRLKIVFNDKYSQNKGILFNILETRKESIFHKFNLDHTIINLKPFIKNSIENGDLTFYNLDYSEGDHQLNSAFHKNMLSNENFLDFMRNDKGFLTSRFLTIAQYFLLKNLGINGKERYYFCYLSYKTIAEYLGKNPIDLIKEF